MQKLHQKIIFICCVCIVSIAGNGLILDAQADEQNVKGNPVSRIGLAISDSLASFMGTSSAVSAASSGAQASPEIPPKPVSPASRPIKGAYRSEKAAENQNELYDPTNDAYSSLQKANEALAGFMLDKRTQISWMQVLRGKLIAPRADKLGVGKMEVLDLDIILKNTKSMPNVKFPHSSHTMWLACSNCHDQIFIPKAGANPITMQKILKGQYCGVCHDKVAFTMFNSCENCHSVPQQGGVQSWWD